MNPKVDWFFAKPSKWQEEYSALRLIVLDCGLKEDLKWGCPCYSLEKDNIVLIHGFKNYCALLFMQGALMKDAKKILIQQTEYVQAARQIRFADLAEIVKIKSSIKEYINDAIAIDKAGLKLELKKTNEFKIPLEFQKVLDETPKLNFAFKSLTPGRQRAYIIYFSSAKQAKTREARINNSIVQILNGKGLDD